MGAGVRSVRRSGWRSGLVAMFVAVSGTFSKS